MKDRSRLTFDFKGDNITENFKDKSLELEIFGEKFSDLLEDVMDKVGEKDLYSFKMTPAHEVWLKKRNGKTTEVHFSLNKVNRPPSRIGRLLEERSFKYKAVIDVYGKRGKEQIELSFAFEYDPESKKYEITELNPKKSGYFFGYDSISVYEGSILDYLGSAIASLRGERFAVGIAVWNAETRRGKDVITLSYNPTCSFAQVQATNPDGLAKDTIDECYDIFCRLSEKPIKWYLDKQ